MTLQGDGRVAPKMNDFGRRMESSESVEETADGRKGSGRHLLTVDEEAVRPRANSDPTVRVGAFPFLLPEITVEDFTDPEQGGPLHHHSKRQDGLNQQDEGGLFGAEATPRRRANTCPDDLFRRKSERPPTPPPGSFRKGPGRLGRGKGKAGPGLCKSPLKEVVSFTHHRLTKLPESEAEESGPGPTAAVRLTSSAARVKRASFSGFASERVEVCAWPQPHFRDDATSCFEDKVVDLFPSLSKSFGERLGMSEEDEGEQEEETLAPHPASETGCPVSAWSQPPVCGVTRKKCVEKKDSGCCSCKTSPTTATSGEGRCREEGEAGTRCHGCLADSAASCPGCGGGECGVHQGFCGQSSYRGHGETSYEGGDAELPEVSEEDEEEAPGETTTTTTSTSRDSVVAPTPASTPGAQCGWTQEPARGLDTSQLQAC